MDGDDIYAAIMCIVIGVILIMLGVSGGKWLLQDRLDTYQDQAIERGYAEWATPEGGRGEMVFQWIEQEVTSDE